MNPQLLQFIMQLLAGSGFKNITKGVSDLASSGTDLQSLMQMPGLPAMMAGAGAKDMANSMEVLQPIMKMLQPPPPPPQPKPEEMSAAMQMLSARLAPRQQGLMLTPGASPMGMGGGPMPMGPQTGY